MREGARQAITGRRGHAVTCALGHGASGEASVHVLGCDPHGESAADTGTDLLVARHRE